MKRRTLRTLLALAMIAATIPLAGPAVALSEGVVISQVYGGGGNAGAPYTNDFVELFNRGTSSVSLAGMSVQYASATGTGNFVSNPIAQLSGSLAPGQSYLVQLAGGATGVALPTADATGTANMSGTSGKVALVNSSTGLACNGGSTLCSAEQLGLILDLVGYGTANFFETAAAPTASNTLAVIRNGGGCDETDNNAADFSTGTPSPRNTASPSSPCGPAEPKINEFSASTAGTDVEYVEFIGTPDTDYSGYTLLEIEGDSGAAVGTIDEVVTLGTTGATGLQLVTLPANALENGTLSLLLVKDFTGAVGTDLDTDNNGVFDTTPWEAVVDSVAVNDGGAGDVTFGAPSLGVSYDGAPFAPGGASRIPDGVDTDTAADWVRNDFDLAGIPGFVGTPILGEALNTPGAANVAITADTNTVTITATDGDAAEAGRDPGTFQISRTGSTAAALIVNYTLGGSAVPGDYTPVLAGSAEVAAGAAFVDITVTPVDDADAEGPETLNMTLATGTGYVLGAITSASITIADNDSALAITPIHAIQGSGSAVVPGTFTVEGIVVGDYQTQGLGQLRGFFVQEEDVDVDADPATSEGIFVFCSACPTAVAVGDEVQVTGASSDFFGMSQLSATTADSVIVVSSGNLLPTPATIDLPVPGVPDGDLAAATAVIDAYFERSEGMRVTLPDTLAISEYFELARYGQVILTEGGRPRTFTDANVPSATGLVNHEIDLARRTIILDDNDNRQNRPVDEPNTPYFHPIPGLTTTNYFRGGDTITGLTGVLHWSFAGQTGTDAWRIRPETYTVTPANPRPATPEVGGDVKVASFNVLNYFLTIDTTASNSLGTCGPSGTQDCRGADSAQELARQRTKLLAALDAIDADVVGLMEMENTPGVEPLADIVAGLPGYGYIDTGVIGGDAIRVGIIYKTGTVTPVGAHAILDSSIDPRFIDTANRPVLAQTFQEIATGARFTVAVNHLKSKGSGCGAGDDDTTSGQGNCNGTRTLAAQALADWLSTDPTGSGDLDMLIIGDLNSYAKEDPIVALQSAGYTNLVASFGGPDAYGYVFDGQLGYLDHALSNVSMTPQVAGVAEWHINADEIPLFDYNDTFRDPGESSFEKESDALLLYEPNAFRTSDHDPVIIGLDLEANNAPVLAASPESQTVQYSDPVADVTITGTDVASDLPLDASTQWKVDGGAFTTGLPTGLSLTDDGCDTSSCAWTLSGTADVEPGTYVVQVTVTDGSGDGSTIDITIEVAPEDARATYTGALYASTASTTSTSASVTLAATVRDITVTADAAGDVWPGDIRNATVTFINRDTNTPIAGCINLPVGLVNPGEEQTGTATCQWNLTISGDAQLFTVGVIVGDHYTRNDSADNVVVTVAKPLATNFIAGGGFITLTDSAGTVAGDDGSNANFGFSVKPNRSGKNLQGSVNIIVRRTESDGVVHVYQIKANSMTSLAVQTSTGTATFNSKASIQDITDPLDPVSVGGNATLQITMDDNGEPGSSDTIGITVWDKDGGVWFASNFDGVKTIEQTLDGGNLNVR